MRNSISEVLEKMFFLPLDFSEAGTPGELWEDPAAADLMAVRLSFAGPFSGSLVFLIPRKLGVDLTADFMGVEKDAVPPEHVEQTVEEILNMIAGSTFSILDDQAVYELGIPESTSAQQALAATSSPRGAVFQGVDTLDSRIALALVGA
ncbi:MAG: chemotaxis protein CheX [Deltaproteobacteria bacterium]|nr:chemotaxis protein CheX [Deltaproteobacteria bacterium]